MPAPAEPMNFSAFHFYFSLLRENSRAYLNRLRSSCARGGWNRSASSLAPAVSLPTATMPWYMSSEVSGDRDLFHGMAGSGRPRPRSPMRRAGSRRSRSSRPAPPGSVTSRPRPMCFASAARSMSPGFTRRLWLPPALPVLARPSLRARVGSGREPSLEHAAIHQLALLRGHAFRVVVAACEFAGNPWVFEDLHCRREYLRVESIEEERGLAIQARSACRRDVVADEARLRCSNRRAPSTSIVARRRPPRRRHRALACRAARRARRPRGAADRDASCTSSRAACRPRPRRPRRSRCSPWNSEIP